MQKLVLGVMMLAASLAAEVQAAPQALITCVGTTPTLTLTYSPGADGGSPGVFYVGITDPAQQQASFLDQTNTWQAYPGGLYIPEGVYQGGIPGSITLKAAMPGTDYTTSAYVGWTIYAGHGILTSDAQALVANRRSALNAVKPQRVAAGTWNPDYDSDDRFKLSLVQKNMVDAQKYMPAITVPMVDCTPYSGG